MVCNTSPKPDITQYTVVNWATAAMVTCLMVFAFGLGVVVGLMLSQRV